MELEDPDSLSPREVLREKEVMEKFFDLMNVQRSRYEEQAKSLSANKTLRLDSENFVLEYSISGNRYKCESIPDSKNGDSFSIELPIPDSEEERVEALVQLFAQSEAGLIQ